MRLPPENLLAAGEASSYEAMMTVLATGRAESTIPEAVPNALGDTFRDLVYTPVIPCRIVDTRSAVAGALAGGATRTFDVDSSSLTAQGGSSTGCGIPFAVAHAVTMTIVAVQPAGPGFLTAFGLTEGSLSSVLDYAANDVIANTAIIPVVPGGGDDFALFSLAPTHVVVDVLGYFAASSATRLDYVTVSSGVVEVPLRRGSSRHWRRVRHDGWHARSRDIVGPPRQRLAHDRRQSDRRPPERSDLRKVLPRTRAMRLFTARSQRHSPLPPPADESVVTSLLAALVRRRWRPGKIWKRRLKARLKAAWDS